MPEALISRITSRGPGVGSGNSLSSSLRSPRNTTPFMVLLRCAVFGEARSDAPAASDRSASSPRARRLAARPRPRPDPELSAGRIHFGVSTSVRSSDPLVGAGEERWGYFEAKRLGGLHVDHQLVFCWRLHWQVCRLRALENAVDIVGCAPQLIDGIRPIGD